jgi:TPP-dependent pyruvate/acetoin dehydrogenase alpha subunit
LTARFDAEVSEHVAACETFPPPPVETLFEDVLAEPGRQLAEQRDAYLRFLAGRAAEFEDVP